MDTFVFLDSVQFTKRDWRTRNRILTTDGPKWLSLPVHSKGQSRTPISQIEVANPNWRTHHLSVLRHAYSRTAGFKDFFPLLEAAYVAANSRYLSRVNQTLVGILCAGLGITTTLVSDSELELSDELGPTERLAAIAEKLGATTYVTGPSAADYLSEAVFFSRNIQLEYFNYPRQFSYPQHGNKGFTPNLSIVDLLLNGGSNAIVNQFQDPKQTR